MMVGRWGPWEVTESEANMKEQNPFLPAPRIWSRVLSPSGGWWLGMLAWVEGEVCPGVTLGPGWLVCDLGWSIQEDLETKS